MFIYIIMCKSNYNAIADNLSINETDLINYPAVGLQLMCYKK